MRRNAIIGALLLIVVGVALGATVFRIDIAQATGLAQSVTVDNTAANPVPVLPQGTTNVQGVVSAHPIAPASPWHESKALVQLLPGGGAAFFAGPTTGAINLTSLSVGSIGANPASAAVRLGAWYVPDSATECAFVERGEGVWTMQHIPTPLAIAFPTPVQILAPSGRKVCLAAELIGESGPMNVNASGFYGD
jgi:hypothetical protein